MAPSQAELWHRAILDLLRAINLRQPDQLPQLVNEVSAQLAKEIRIYLVDFEQRVLRELSVESRAGDQLPVEGSIAGLAFQRGQVQVEPGDAGVVWVPLVDSAERLGVLRIATDNPRETDTDDDPDVQFANLLGHLITAKTPYSDRLHQSRSSQPMTVASVLLRQLLPPSTFTSDRLVISASLQPAYTVGGDAYDYAMDDDTAHIGIFDGVGHGLASGLSVAVAMSATRAGRRNGDDLDLMAQSADHQLAAEFNDGRFVTAVLARLDVRSGLLSYLSAGHPAPVVFRPNGGTITLEQGRRLPLGIITTATEVQAAEGHLQPGDRLLLYTDGVIESRNRDGEMFGIERLIDLVRRHTTAYETTPEAARRINDAVVEFHDGLPEDDSTILLLEWSSTAADRTLP
jgi:serine phosphatase RsbU (regulator of sigma subunit)